MAKKSTFSLQDAYAAQAGDPDESQQAPEQESGESSESPVTIQGADLQQAEQLKASGDQSGDYSELGKFIAGLMGGSPAAAPAM